MPVVELAPLNVTVPRLVAVVPNVDIGMWSAEVLLINTAGGNENDTPLNENDDKLYCFI